MNFSFFLLGLRARETRKEGGGVRAIRQTERGSLVDYPAARSRNIVYSLKFVLVPRDSVMFQFESCSLMFIISKRSQQYICVGEHNHSEVGHGGQMGIWH